MVMPQEYRDYLRANLSTLERFAALFSGLDERLDYTNLLLTRILERLGGTVPGPSPSPSPNPSPGAIANRSTFITGSRTVDTAGTAVQLSSASIPIPDGFYVTVVARPSNSGYVYVSMSKSDAEGFQKFDGLDPGMAVSLRIKDVNLVWINSSIDGDGASFIVER